MTRKFASFVRFSRLNTIMKRTLLLIYFTIIFITSVSAQLYQYLDTNDGLSSRRVLSIQKDNKGYMCGSSPMKESTGTMASNMFITAYQQTVNLI